MKLRFFYLLFPLIFTGCALPPDPELQINNSWESHKNQLEQLTDWSLSGKLGIFSPEGRESVNINWQQSKNGFHIRLNGPLGINVLDIQKVDNNNVIIDGEKYHSNNPEQLIAELSGMVLPIEQLQQWIKGNPSGASYQLDDNHQLSSLLGGQTSTGLWLINYADYRTIEQINLPHKLQLTRGDLRLKFKISNWQIPIQRPVQTPSQQ
ncbi:lipoprotein insertase outer membrane protein LolB [Psychromonas sp. Urea-02u-13]|uniref:lipoprotein insertase outer membrane protein LolB n=1 Tax=Psychromonas sp. Urea-02u-13 TaxID=2058326 RepID=UPI000C32EE30|nr:lipoprotein insertase outer membrane protein LolB [Psychromonas sp. Urea-02u-13]PKG38390.1 outer membrane lipoprotein LolB [Psychromonas sp. Urea-02u-13]